MKIMIVTAAGLPIPAYKGGATETLITELLKRVRKEDGIFIDVYSNCSQKDGYTNGDSCVSYNYIPKTFFDKLYTMFFRILRLALFKKIYIPSAFASRLCRIVDLNKYDIIIAEGDKGQINILRRHFKKTLVLHIHTVMTFTKDTPFAKKILSACDLVLGNSIYTKNVISEIDKEQSDKVIAFQNCIETDVFKLPEDTVKRNEIRHKYDIKDDERVYIYCGRLEEGKGVRELIKAFKLCDKKSKLLIVGAGWFSSDKKTPFINELIALCEDIKDRIIFTGYVPHCKINEYYYAADVCVVPSVYEEAACLVVLEAQACGLPVIASNIGGIPEFAFPASSVLIDVDEKFIESLAESMQSDLTEKSKALYDNEFRTFIMGKSMDAYYKEFLKIIQNVKDGNNEEP